ncbi:hypothetical protein [Labrys miyagiensis]|nr:hypothetical protein [Labrys miyagiensis]
MAKLGAAELPGIHVNLPGFIPPEIVKVFRSGDSAPKPVSRRTTRFRAD